MNDHTNPKIAFANAFFTKGSLHAGAYSGGPLATLTLARGRIPYWST
jgi:hypothetical protein